MEEHPTESELEGYAKGVLSAGDLLRVDDHLATCVECRRRAADALDAGPRLAAVVSAIRHELAESQAPAVSGFRPSLNIRWTAGKGMAALAAAAMLIIVADIVWGTRAGAPAEPAPVQAARVTVDQLSATERAAVDAAVASGVISRAPELRLLTPTAGVLMGSQAERFMFGPTFPVGVVIDADRPRLEWSPADEATSYRVSVFDENFNRVVSSPWVKDTWWTVDQALPRGSSYVWQITARVGDREVVAPVPPQPESRFKVTSVEQSAQLADLRRRAGDSHLALAVLLAEAGVLDEAERELSLARTANPESSAVKRLQQSLASLRR